MNSIWKAALPIIIGLLIFVIPVPQGLDPNAWRYFAVFMAVVAGLILEPLPAAAVGFIGVTLATALLMVSPEMGQTPAPRPQAKPTASAPASALETPSPVQAAPAPATSPAAPSTPAAPAIEPKKEPVKVKPADAIRWALAGFSDGTVWLIFIAFMFAMGYEKTGLGKRIALIFVKRLGKRTLGLGYAIALADLALASNMPSNTARGGGTIFPIIKNIPPLYGSYPDQDPRKIGSYLIWTAFAANAVTSSMFLTALAPNLLAKTIIQKTANLEIQWMEWFTAFLPVGVVLFLLVPLLAYLIYPPTQKTSEEASTWATQELAKLGPVSPREWIMAGLAALALGLWIFGDRYFNATTVGMMALSLMLLTGVVTWDDVISNKQAWSVLAWFGSLVALADGLNKVGFLKWLVASTATAFAGFSPTAMVVLFLVLFFITHYMFASTTAHTTALLPVMMLAAMAVPGLPLKVMAILFGTSLGLMGVISPYATGPAPIFFGSRYVANKEFWLLGLVFGAIYLAVLLGIGIPYMLWAVE